MKLLYNIRAFSQIPEEKKLSKDAVLSLIIHGCYMFGTTMSAVFLNLYLWRLTESLWINGMYNLIGFIFTVVGFALGGYLAKKKGVLSTYRLGIALLAIFYLFVIIARENVVDFAYLFAVFNGTALGFYWVGYITLMYDVSTEKNRIRYLALNFITLTSASLAGPALAGFIISLFEGLSGYIIVFTFAFIMFFLTTLGSFRLKSEVTHHQTYYLKYMLLMMKKDRRWLKSLYAWFVLGLKQGIMMFLPPILLYHVLLREDYVGYANVILSISAIVTGYVISRVAKENLARFYIIISTIIFSIGSIFIIWGLNIYTVLIFLVFFNISQPLQINSFSAYSYRLMSKLPLKGHLRIEAVVMREVFVNSGRVVSVFILICFVTDLATSLMAWIIFIVSIIQLSLFWLVDKDA